MLFKCVQVDSLIELKEHEDLSLAEEAERNWIEVLDQTYLFDRRRREVGAVVTHIAYWVAENHPKLSASNEFNVKSIKLTIDHL